MGKKNPAKYEMVIMYADLLVMSPTSMISTEVRWVEADGEGTL